MLAVLATVTSLGVPAWQSWAARWQVQATIDTLGRSLVRSRSEAMATGRSITFQAGSLPDGLRWLTGPPPIRFGATGGATPGTLTVCPRIGTGQSLVVSRTGRIRGTRADCGFALTEVLIGLLILAVGTLATQQALLAGAAAASQQERLGALLDAAASGTEALRAAADQPARMPSDLLAAWTGTFAVAGDGRPAVAVRLEAHPNAAGTRVLALAEPLHIDWQVDP